MLERETLLAIMNGLPDEQLMYALDAIGVNTGMSPQGQSHLDPEYGIGSWNERSVKAAQSNRPLLFDKAQFEEQPAAPQEMPPYLQGPQPMAGPEDLAMQQAEQDQMALGTY